MRFDFSDWCDWRSCASALVQVMLPEIGSAVYIIDDATANALRWRDRNDCLGYTSLGLSLFVRPYFEGLNLWAGPGFACRIRDEAIRSRGNWSLDHVLNYVLHELAHDVQRPMEVKARLAQRHRWDELSEIATASGLVIDDAESKPCSATQPWIFHDGRFIRAALHLAHRARQAGFPANETVMEIAGPQHWLEPWQWYADDLEVELRSRESQPLLDVLATVAPRDFAARFERDAFTAQAAWQAVHGITSDAGTGEYVPRNEVLMRCWQVGGEPRPDW